MSPPLLILCIPGVALFFFIQTLLCQAYHFHVTLSKSKRRDCCKTMRNKNLSMDDISPIRNHRLSKHIKIQEPVGDSEEFLRTSQETVDYLDHHFNIESARQRRKSVFAESYDPAQDVQPLHIVNPKTHEEREWLIKNLTKITLFQHLAKDQVITVADAMYKHSVKAGDLVVRQGEVGNLFYVIQSGQYNVFVMDEDTKRERLQHTYEDRGSFGELALLYNQPRAATIVAKTDGVLWAVDGHTFRRIVNKITYQKRLMYENLINNVPVLRALAPYQRSNLVDALVPMTFVDEEVIFKQGDQADGMYFIVSGGVQIVKETSSEDKILVKELSDSDYFGELALVTNKTRAASAYSVGTSHLAFLDRGAFERLLGPCMDLIKRHIGSYNGMLTTNP